MQYLKNKENDTVVVDGVLLSKEQAEKVKKALKKKTLKESKTEK
jgi:hypothetical protein